MALVIIQLQDNPNGVGVNLTTEPRIVAGKTEFTLAERLGAMALTAIHAGLEEPEKRIVLAGADELPIQ